MEKQTIIKYFAGRWNSYYEALIEGKLKPLGRKGEFQGLCPLHFDQRPSLTINQHSGLWKCFGCDQGGNPFDFWAKLKGLSTTTNFKEIVTGIAEQFNLNGRGSERPNRSRKRIVTTYSYTDENGKLLFQTVRYEPKQFKQRQPDGKGGWIWNLKGIRLVPYQLPRLIKAQEVLIVEGEKDTDNLIRLGFCATTFPMGAGKWRPEYAKWFKSKDCVLLPDCDQPGREHMNTIAESLQGVAASVKLLELPDLPEKGDVSDWITQQPDRETAFERLCIMLENAEPWTPPLEAENETINSEDIPSFKLTDLGNAERLINRHGQDIRFCYPWGKWLVWTGRQWSIDESGEVERRSKETVRKICREVTTGLDEDQVKAIYKHAACSEANLRIQAMIKLARSEAPIMPSDFDKDTYLLNVQNGVLDLKTGGLLSHKRENLITKIAPVEFDPKAQCPAWLRFLDRIFDGNSSMIEYCRRVVGYSLTGDTSEQCFFLLWGTGANGKSTFLETIRALQGDYSQQANFETFLAKKNDSGASNDLAALKSARFVSAIEAGSSRSLNEALIKQITGGEAIRARFLYGEFFEFHPVFKLFLATNHKPRIRDTDYGIWRRVRLIPFDVTIPKEEQDLKLLDKLIAKLPSILNWALQGCREWIECGLGEPEEVLKATSEYRASEDALDGFIKDRCTLSPAARVKTGDLKKAYKEWCAANEEEPVYHKTFATLLESRGCKSGRDYQGRFWEGVELNP